MIQLPQYNTGIYRTSDSPDKLLSISTEERKRLRKWYTARSIFLGLDGYVQNFGRGVELAKRSDHPDALRLCSLFPNGTGLRTYVIKVLTLHQDEDPMNLCFLGLILGDYHLIERAADRGYSLAMLKVYYKEVLNDSWKPFTQFEPGAIYLLACSYGIQRDVSQFTPQKYQEMCELLKLAADLGSPIAMYYYGKQQFGRDDRRRYYWIGKSVRRAGARTSDFDFFDHVECRIQQFMDKYSNPTLAPRFYCYILYELGRTIEGRFHQKANEIFGREISSEFLIGRLKFCRAALYLYRSWRQQTIDAVNCWTLIGRRLKISKDIIRMISQYLWAARGDCDYPVDIEEVGRIIEESEDDREKRILKFSKMKQKSDIDGLVPGFSLD